MQSAKSPSQVPGKQPPYEAIVVEMAETGGEGKEIKQETARGRKTDGEGMGCG